MFLLLCIVYKSWEYLLLQLDSSCQPVNIIEPDFQLTVFFWGIPGEPGAVHCDSDITLWVNEKMISHPNTKAIGTSSVFTPYAMSVVFQHYPKISCKGTWKREKQIWLLMCMSEGCCCCYGDQRSRFSWLYHTELVFEQIHETVGFSLSLSSYSGWFC